ncbi:hypothetical protein D9M70_459000 [compost metagenome]
MRVEPVAETSGTFGLSTRTSPTVRSPMRTCDRPSGASPKRASARSKIAWQASAVSGVFSDGFQTTELPQTSASAVFHDQTATGKLKAEMTPTTPSGCQVSIMRWPGRSVAIVRPYSWRERPTAKSQMSIISWTSPRPSEVILPASIETRRPRSALKARSSSPSRRISSPRFGAGTRRQALKAS